MLKTLLLLVTVLVPSHGQQFDVASIKVAPPFSADSSGRVFISFGPMTGGPGTPDPTHITWANATLRNVILAAYDLRSYQLTGPAWLGSERYDFAVGVPEGATKAQVAVMWQKLLAERFGMVVHHETKEFQVDQLVLARGGHKLKETTETAPAEEGARPTFVDGKMVGPGLVTMMTANAGVVKAQVMGKAQGMTELAKHLDGQVGHPVVDKTGLTGKYDFTVEFSPAMNGGGALSAPPPSPGAAPSVALSDTGLDMVSAVQQQLGLRLEKGKGMLDIVVVDKAEKVPTEN